MGLGLDALDLGKRVRFLLVSGGLRARSLRAGTRGPFRPSWSRLARSKV
jgi:hypothetical protein